MGDRLRDSIKEANDTGVSLLFTDLNLATTMLERAETSSDEETRKRNLEHVGQACASVRHFMGKLHLSDKEARSLTQKLEELQSRLRRLQEQ